MTLLVLVVLAGCGLPLGGSVGPNEWWLTATTPDRQQLLVTSLYGGVASGCSRWEDWEVSTSDEEVEIAGLLWRKRLPSGCTDDGAQQTLLVDLDAPLGDRALTGCLRDDCATDPFPGWLGGDVSRVTAAGERVAVADAASLRVLEADGTLRWEATRTVGAVGDLLASRDIVIATDGSGAAAWDAATGDQIWRTPVRPVLVADEVVLGCTEDEVRGLDPSSGAARWEIAASCGPAALRGSTAVMIANDPEVDGGQELIVFDVRDGEIATRRAFGDGVDDRVEGFSGVLATEDGFLIAGTQADVVVVDASGVEQARTSSIEGHPAGVVDGVVVLTTHDRVTGVDERNGSELWGLPTDPSAIWTVTPAAVVRLDGPTGELSRVDARTGQAVWSTQVGSSASLAASAAGSGQLYARTLLAELLIDLGSGEVLSWSPTPPAVDEVRNAG